MPKTQSIRVLNRNRESLEEGIILSVYMILKPFYLFSSGLPQISDMFLIAAAIAMLLRERGKIRIKREYVQWVFVFLGTVVFQVLVQIVWWMKLSDDRMLLYSAYYVFNCIASLLCIYIGQHIGIRKLKLSLCKGCFFSVIVTAIGIITQSRYHGIRTMGFFNNPNQLGYYALLIITIIAFFPDQLPKWQNAMILVVAAWANLLSLSKASIIGLGGLAICYAIWGSKKKTLKKIALQALMIAALFGAVYWLLYSNSRIVLQNSTLSFLRRRILGLSMENDSSLAIGRGYSRVWEMGRHFLWGKGEGAYYRFDIMTGYEAHSTFVNVLVSYGLIGFFAYLYLMIYPLQCRGEVMRNFACFSGIFLYSFTHNGIRNTLLWILIAVGVQMCNYTDWKDAQEVI